MFHILVVEDNDNTRKLMLAVLSQNGYEPIPARDGVEALEVLDRKHVDLIVLDIMMPRMDGYEFTETLRASGCDLPILMVTAKEKPADKHKGFLIGTDDYMTKPCLLYTSNCRVGGDGTPCPIDLRARGSCVSALCGGFGFPRPPAP